MREIAALVMAFILIVVLLYRKVHIGTTMFIASAVIGLLGGSGLPGTLGIAFNSIVNRSTVELLAVVTLICILSHLLYIYRILDKMVDSLEELFKSNKILIMLIPSIMGVLFIPGGAVLSAPVVGSLGDRLDFDNARKSAINLVFRHAWFLVFPFSTAMVLASQLAETSPYSIIKFNVPLTITAVFISYIVYLKKSSVKNPMDQRKPTAALPVKLGWVLLYTSPLWFGILLNLAFGLPFYIALIPGIAIIYLITAEDRSGFLKEIVKGIKPKMLYSVMGIMVLQGFIKQTPVIKQIINSILDTGMDIRVLIIAAASIIGFLTASNPAVVGMLYPIFLPLAQGLQTKALFASLIFATGFLFYFISPLHLCQVFTAEYFNIRVKEIYLEYRVVWPVLFLMVLILYLIVY